MSLQLKNLSCSYKKKLVLSGLNLSVKKGEFLAILGENGSGKTTLSYCLNGLIPHALPAKLTGEVLVSNKNTKKISISDISKIIGTVFQDPEMVLFNNTVYEEVLFGVENLKLNYPEKRVEKALQQMNLDKLSDENPHNLSEGQKQKLCIACVLALETEYILLDEPIAHLDYKNAVMIYDILTDLNKLGKTIIVIEHDTDFVFDYCKRTIVLNKGKIIEDNDTKEVLKDKAKLMKYGIKPCFKL